MSSLAWLKPSIPKQAKWLKMHLRRSYPNIHQALIWRCGSDSDKQYCHTFKTTLDEYWSDKYEKRVQLSRIRNAWDAAQSRESRGTKSLSIQLESDIKKKFSDFVKQHKLTQAEFIEELLHYYNQPQGKLDLFKTKEQRIQAAQEKESLMAEIVELKNKLASSEQKVEQLLLQVKNKQVSRAIKGDEIAQGDTTTPDQAMKDVIERNIPSASFKT